MSELQVVRTIEDLRARSRQWRSNGDKIALVPTMGALHAGHLALVRRAGELAERTVVSIFVNPASSPRTRISPAIRATKPATWPSSRREGGHLVWAPTAAEMYPEGFATRIEPAGAAQGLESDFRPHFFGGVATVCAKLFGAATPDVAVFGEKDYQQLCVIRQMVRDLNLPLAIAGVPTVREADGLALSSRNAYLSAEERKVAPALNRVLRDIAEQGACRGEAGRRCPRAARRRARRRWCATRRCRRRRTNSPTLMTICATAATMSCWRRASARSTTSPCAMPTR